MPTITEVCEGGRGVGCIAATERRGFAINPAVVCTELDDELILLDVEGGTYFGLDAVGATIWKLIAAGADEGAVLEHLLAEYDVEPERLRADVADFLDLLTARGLARPADG